MITAGTFNKSRETGPGANNLATSIDLVNMQTVKFGLFAILFAFGSVNSWAADTIKGAQIYAAQCATCHGTTGISVMPDAPNFAKNESLMQPDPSLFNSIKYGKNAMPSYQGILKDQDILDVIVYLRTLN